jgi:heterodisulfide reductase subunit C
LAALPQKRHEKYNLISMQYNLKIVNGGSKLSSLDAYFMHEVANTPRGRGVLACIQCGRCTSSCPVARVIDEHNPRKLMEMIILGLRPEIILGALPWYCLSCFTCLDRCPQGGDVGEVMFAIRNLAVREGNVPKGILVQAQSLFESGRVVTPSRTALINREKYGLGKEPAVDVEAVQKILRKTSFDKLIYRGS